MTRDRALAALDKAIDDEVSLLFKTLVSNVIGDVGGCGDKFAAGMKFTKEAVRIATTTIETIFPE